MRALTEMTLEELASEYSCGVREGAPEVLIEFRRRQRMLDAADGMHKAIDRERELQGFSTSATMNAYFDYQAAKENR